MNQKEKNSEREMKIEDAKGGFYKIFAPFKVALKKITGAYKAFFEAKEKDENYFDHLSY